MVWADQADPVAADDRGGEVADDGSIGVGEAHGVRRRSPGGWIVWLRRSMRTPVARVGPRGLPRTLPAPAPGLRSACGGPGFRCGSRPLPWPVFRRIGLTAGVFASKGVCVSESGKLHHALVGRGDSTIRVASRPRIALVVTNSIVGRIRSRNSSSQLIAAMSR